LEIHAPNSAAGIDGMAILSLGFPAIMALVVMSGEATKAASCGATLTPR
jgi:hypothetical protein